MSPRSVHAKQAPVHISWPLIPRCRALCNHWVPCLQRNLHSCFMHLLRACPQKPCCFIYALRRPPARPALPEPSRTTDVGESTCMLGRLARWVGRRQSAARIKTINPRLPLVGRTCLPRLARLSAVEADTSDAGHASTARGPPALILSRTSRHCRNGPASARGSIL